MENTGLEIGIDATDQMERAEGTGTLEGLCGGLDVRRGIRRLGRTASVQELETADHDRFP